MKPACCVYNTNIGIASFAVLNCVKNNGSRIGAFGGFDKINIRTIRPNLKLLYRDSEKNVCCTENNATALHKKEKSKQAKRGEIKKKKKKTFQCFASFL